MIFCLTSMKNIRQDGEKPLLYLTGYMLRQIASSWETPVLAAARPEENQVETVSYNGETYLVCGKWNLQGERISMKLVQKPVPGSILVNGELAPTAEQKKAL